MVAQKLDGKATAAEIRGEIAVAVTRMARAPGLATLLVGDDPGSDVYVRNKHKACEEVGFHSRDVRLPADSTQEAVTAAIDTLNGDPEIDGFIVQLPLPAGLDEKAALERIDPDKDADGLHPLNLGRLVLGEPGPLPCTPKGIVTLGERFTVVGRGTTVGRPLGLILTQKGVDSTVTLCHSRTKDLAARTREADIVVVAAGRAGLLAPDMVRPGAVVFDVGISRTEDGIAGDVAPDVDEVASWVAPVPGGVGPMTIAMLLTNTLDAARRHSG